MGVQKTLPAIASTRSKLVGWLGGGDTNRPLCVLRLSYGWWVVYEPSYCRLLLNPGAPGRNRTCNLSLRTGPLCPIELQGRVGLNFTTG